MSEVGQSLSAKILEMTKGIDALGPMGALALVSEIRREAKQADAVELTAEQRADWESTMHFYMASISERHNCTQWDSDLCPSLIASVEDIQKNGVTQSRAGGIWITAAEAETLQFMVDKLGYWWDYSKPYDPADYVERDAEEGF